MGMLPVGGMQQQEQPQFQQHTQEEPMYDDSAFEAAFAQVTQHAQDLAMEEYNASQAVDESREMQGSDLLNKDALQMDHLEPSDLDHGFPALERTPSPIQYRIGSDAIPYKEQKLQGVEENNRDADELARTAGQLLNSVQHDTSDKFQNSQFLSLMRKIRDGEVRVQGEEFRETNGANDMVSSPSD